MKKIELKPPTKENMLEYVRNIFSQELGTFTKLEVVESAGIYDQTTGSVFASDDNFSIKIEDYDVETNTDAAYASDSSGVTTTAINEL